MFAVVFWRIASVNAIDNFMKYMSNSRPIAAILLLYIFRIILFASMKQFNAYIVLL